MIALLVIAVVSSVSEPTRTINVACVGDSITAGYLASNSSMAYPERLQAKLTARYGAGSYKVDNFGAGGATVQRGADSPYWNRTQFQDFIKGSYDIIIIMLGTNDAKSPTAECIARWGPTSMCAADWPAACSLPNATAESCTVIKDYLSLIKLASTLGNGSHAPLIAIMTPPPLWKDGAYGMDQSVLNDVMPRLVPQIAHQAGLPAPIDIFTLLGGTSDWQSTFPACGCVRPAAVETGLTSRGSKDAATTNFRGANALSLSTSAGDIASTTTTSYTATQGYMGVGEVIAERNWTWSEAAAACSANSQCAGFTFKSNSSKPITAVDIRLKQCEGMHTPPLMIHHSSLMIHHAIYVTGVSRNSHIGWWSWTKPLSAMPPAPTMPTSCAMFCQTGQSCDACHPDDDGYDLLATSVYEWILARRQDTVGVMQDTVDMLGTCLPCCVRPPDGEPCCCPPPGCPVPPACSPPPTPAPALTM
jgi:lysophospholipase L1-like esterase